MIQPSKPSDTSKARARPPWRRSEVSGDSSAGNLAACVKIVPKRVRGVVGGMNAIVSRDGIGAAEVTGRGLTSVPGYFIASTNASNVG
jgi:hypothetical protein